MADRTQLRVADNNDISDDDPFAELTRIMGFDPRQPARPQTPAVDKAAPGNQAAEEPDFGIDLEKELMGDLGAEEEHATVAFEPVSSASAHETAVAATDEELAAALEQDFIFDDAADHAHFATGRAPELEADIAFDDDFDQAVANSLEVSPVEDDLSIDQDIAASLD
ncbi:MAG: SPOR domain-containing protein, partial [Mesorhizobium sp.]